MELNDPDVSRRHAVVRRVDEGLAVEDLGSTNGTFVNDRRVEGIAELVDRRPGPLRQHRLAARVRAEPADLLPAALDDRSSAGLIAALAARRLADARPAARGGARRDLRRARARRAREAPLRALRGAARRRGADRSADRGLAAVVAARPLPHRSERRPPPRRRALLPARPPRGRSGSTDGTSPHSSSRAATAGRAAPCTSGGSRPTAGSRPSTRGCGQTSTRTDA